MKTQNSRAGRVWKSQKHSDDHLPGTWFDVGPRLSCQLRCSHQTSRKRWKPHNIFTCGVYIPISVCTCWSGFTTNCWRWRKNKIPRQKRRQTFRRTPQQWQNSSAHHSQRTIQKCLWFFTKWWRWHHSDKQTCWIKLRLFFWLFSVGKWTSSRDKPVVKLLMGVSRKYANCSDTALTTGWHKKCMFDLGVSQSGDADFFVTHKLPE